MNDTPKHTRTIQEMYAAFGRGDIPAILERLHTDVLWAANVDYNLPAARNVPCYESGRGHGFVGRYFGLFAQGYEVHGFQIASIMDGGDEAAVRLVVDVTIRRTGRRIRSEAIHHYTFDSTGLVTRFLNIEDTLGFAHAWRSTGDADC